MSLTYRQHEQGISFRPLRYIFLNRGCGTCVFARPQGYSPFDGWMYHCQCEFPLRDKTLYVFESNICPRYQRAGWRTRTA